MSVIDDLIRNAANYAAGFDKGDLPLRPVRKVAVVTCMDARLNTYTLLGLAEGDSHVIRNAGGVVTDDVIRSLAISQSLRATEEVMIILHTDCGMLTFTDDEFREKLERNTGLRPAWAAETFRNLEQEVRQSVARIVSSPFIPHKDRVRGFVYEVETGRLREVLPTPPPQVSPGMPSP